jgi:hypothetical protein
MFQRMRQELKIEKNEFIQHQRKQLLQSGVYNTLDPKIDKMIEMYYELERARIKKYPVSYQYVHCIHH